MELRAIQPHQATCACTNQWHSGENAACRTSPGAASSIERICIASEYAVKGVAEDPRRSVFPWASPCRRRRRAVGFCQKRLGARHRLLERGELGAGGARRQLHLAGRA